MKRGLASNRNSAVGQACLALALGATFGIVLFDRQAVSLLAPWIVAELHLSNAQLGFAAASVSLTWAVAGYGAGRISDLRGRRKPYLIAAVVVFSLCSAASGLVGGFLSLAAVRLLMGLAEGPVPPLATATVLDASDPGRVGWNMAANGLASSLILLATPIVLVGWGETYGWRTAFLLAALPGLFMAAVLGLVVKDRPPVANAASCDPPRRPRDILAVRNVWLCALIASLGLAFGFICLVFLPLYLVNARGLAPAEMGRMMSVFMGTSVAANFVLVALSDRLGRKPIVGFCGACGLILPVAFLRIGGEAGTLLGLVCAGLAAALPAFAIGMIPGESARPADRATALGLVMGIAELMGGFLGPAVVGMAADRIGLVAAPVIAGGCAALAGVLCLFLIETAPRRRSPPGLAVTQDVAPA